MSRRSDPALVEFTSSLGPRVSEQDDWAYGRKWIEGFPGEDLGLGAVSGVPRFCGSLKLPGLSVESYARLRLTTAKGCKSNNGRGRGSVWRRPGFQSPLWWCHKPHPETQQRAVTTRVECSPPGLPIGDSVPKVLSGGWSRRHPPPVANSRLSEAEQKKLKKHQMESGSQSPQVKEKWKETSQTCRVSTRHG